MGPGGYHRRPDMSDLWPDETPLDPATDTRWYEPLADEPEPAAPSASPTAERWYDATRYDHTGFPSLVRYFRWLADDYRGWEGTREWAELIDSTFRLSASHDGLSRITLVVTLGRYADEGWQVEDVFQGTRRFVCIGFHRGDRSIVLSAGAACGGNAAPPQGIGKGNHGCNAGELPPGARKE